MRREALVDDPEIAVDAALEERRYGRIGRGLGPVAQKAVWTEKAIDLLVIEDDPAQRFEFLVLALRHEFARAPREIAQDHARLRQLFRAMREHRRLAHFIDLAAILRRARLPAAKEVDIDRLPV